VYHWGGGTATRMFAKVSRREISLTGGGGQRVFEPNKTAKMGSP